MSEWPITDKEAATLPAWLTFEEVDVLCSGEWPADAPPPLRRNQRDWYPRDRLVASVGERGDVAAVARYIAWREQSRERARLRQCDGSPMVYFIAAEEVARVKIGWTHSLEQRLARHQLSSPVALRLLFWEAGGLADERALHERFSHLRTHGEWFALDPAIKAHIDERRAQLFPRCIRPTMEQRAA